MSKHDISPGGRDQTGRAKAPVVVDRNSLLADGVDWARVLAMTDEEAERNARNDPDSQPLTREQLARMRRAPNPRAIRQRLGLTQEEFARQFQIAVGTLRDWEQGIHVPDSTAKAYLRVIEQAPDAVVAALRASYPDAGRVANADPAVSNRR